MTTLMTVLKIHSIENFHICLYQLILTAAFHARKENYFHFFIDDKLMHKNLYDLATVIHIMRQYYAHYSTWPQSHGMGSGIVRLTYTYYDEENHKVTT